MSLEELSDRLDIPVDCLQEIEEGTRRLSPTTIKEVAQIFGVPEESLRVLDQPPAPIPMEIPPEVTPEGIGRKIRELRTAKGLTLSEMSRRSDLSLAHLSEVERGRSSASLKTLERIAEVLEVPVAVLVGRDECDPLGERVRRLRERVGLTQKELAELVEVSHTLVGQIENGRLQPSVATLTRLAIALGVSPCYFLIEEEDVPRRRTPLDDAMTRALGYQEVRDFLHLMGELDDPEREKVLGFLSWLTGGRGLIGRAGGCSTDPVTQELLQILAGLSPEDKAFLLESARFISRKARADRNGPRPDGDGGGDLV